LKYFTVPYIPEDSYIKTIIREYNKHIYEVYGTDHAFYSAGPSRGLISKQIFNKHIAELRNSDIHFNYLLNSNDIYHRYLSIPNKIKNKLKQLRDLNVEFLTISSPILQDFILSLGFDNFKFINSLTGSEVDSYLRIKQLEKLNYNRILLSENINKNFTTLQYLRKITNLPLEICVNNRYCKKGCLLVQNCYQKYSFEKFYWSYNKKNCERQKSIFNFLSSNYVYPFELSKYKELSINFFKIEGRYKDSFSVLNTVYDYITETESNSNLITKYHQFEVPLNYIDKVYLEDFFNFFKTGSGCSGQCNTCKICYKWAEKIKKDLIDINNNPKHSLYKHLH
jgi:collagenase-like PrtC family protease